MKRMKTRLTIATGAVLTVLPGIYAVVAHLRIRDVPCC